MADGVKYPLAGQQYGSVASSETATTASAGVDTLISPTSVSAALHSAASQTQLLTFADRFLGFATLWALLRELSPHISFLLYVLTVLTVAACCRSNMRRTWEV